MKLTFGEYELMQEALQMAASRHEAMARAQKFGRHHDEKARQMRELRVKLIKERLSVLPGRPVLVVSNPPQEIAAFMHVVDTVAAIMRDDGLAISDIMREG